MTFCLHEERINRSGAIRCLRCGEVFVSFSSSQAVEMNQIHVQRKRLRMIVAAGKRRRAAD